MFTTNYTLTITDAKGCTATCNVTIYVIDVRCGQGNIFICYNGETMSVPKAEVDGWLKKGASLGSCNNQESLIANTTNAARANASVKALSPVASPTFTVYPNPAQSIVNFKWNAPGISNARVVITDLQGRILINQSLTNSAQSINISHLVNGVYMAKLVTPDKTLATTRFMVNK